MGEKSTSEWPSPQQMTSCQQLADCHSRLFIERQEEAKERIWVRRFGIAFIACIVIGIGASILGTIHQNAFLLSSAWFFSSIAFQCLTYSLLPNLVRLFNVGYLFTLLLPEAIFVCAAAFFWALWIVGQQTATLPMRAVTMKDHSICTGNVVLDLSRYLVLKNAAGKLVAIQSAEIQSMELLPELNTKRAVANTTPSASPTGSRSPSEKP